MTERWRCIWAGAASLALLGNAASAAAAKPEQCLTQAEVSNLALVVLPEAIRAAGTACAQTLPATALIRQDSSPLLSKYTAEADRAWPSAKLALGKLGGLGGTSLLDSDLARTMISTLLSAKIAESVKPKSCASIDRIVTLLEPLPAHNAADLLATILQLTADDDLAKGKPAPIPLCPSPKP